LALVSVTCAAFIFFAFTNKDGHFHYEVMSLLFKNQNVENNAKRESALWHIPFEIATLASNEEIMTDPEGLKPNNLSMKQNPYKKK
jgi:hypothetical protein